MKKIVIPFLFISNLFANESLDDLSLDELMNVKVYSATKDYRSIEEIPANIIVITRKDIEKYNYLTLDELIKNVPGLFIINDTEHFQIGSRGSSGSTFQLMLNNNPIFMQRVPYEISSNRNFFAIPVESIDRIEIVKGPQAVTYGSNSMYGSINVITNDFNEKNRISVTKGDNGQDKVFARINHSHENGGFTLNTNFYNTNGLSGDIKDSLKPEIYNKFPNSRKDVDGLTKNEYKTLDFSNRYKNLTTDIYYSNTNYGLFIFPSYRDGTKVDQEEKALSLTYEDEINEKIDYKINYIFSKKRYAIDDLAIFEDTDIFATNLANYEKNQIDAHINYKLNDYIKLLVGSSYEYLANDIKGLASIRNYNVSTQDIYSKVHITPNEKYEFSLGARNIKRGSFDNNLKRDKNLDKIYEEMNIEHFSKIEKNLPELSAIYHINSNNHLKILYGKANQLTYQTMQDFENIESKEINYIYSSKNFSFNNSIFINKANNISLFSQSGGGQASSTKGSVESKGLEMALTYKPSYNFETSSSFTYQQSTNLKDKESEPSFSPDFLAKVSASYIHEDTTYTMWINYISPMGANVNEETFEKGEDSPHNITLNSNIHHKLSKNSSLNLQGLNLLDRNNKIPAGASLIDFHNGFFTQGRTFLLGYDYKF